MQIMPGISDTQCVQFANLSDNIFQVKAASTGRYAALSLLQSELLQMKWVQDFASGRSSARNLRKAAGSRVRTRIPFVVGSMVSNLPERVTDRARRPAM